jgi:hypothetical protein
LKHVFKLNWPPLNFYLVIADGLQVEEVAQADGGRRGRQGAHARAAASAEVGIQAPEEETSAKIFHGQKSCVTANENTPFLNAF